LISQIFSTVSPGSLTDSRLFLFVWEIDVNIPGGDVPHDATLDEPRSRPTVVALPLLPEVPALRGGAVRQLAAGLGVGADGGGFTSNHSVAACDFWGSFF
jgi:hypothetical protein